MCGNGALYVADEQQEDIKKVFELIDGMMFQFGFHYGATISQDLKDKFKELKKRLINA